MEKRSKYQSARRQAGVDHGAGDAFIEALHCYSSAEGTLSGRNL
jgi:hypothetical protein